MGSSKRRSGLSAGRLGMAIGLLTAAALAPPVLAQGVSAPSYQGQWAGPWNLESQMTKDGNGIPYFPATKEIAHAIVVPPANTTDAASPQYGGQVVFINQRAKDFTPPAGSNYPTFLWDPSRPRFVQAHLLVPETVEFDMFCSGHSFLGDGRPFTAGGQNHSTGGTVGQSLSYILGTDDIASGPPQWTKTAGNQADERYYPTVVTLPDGRMLTTGDSSLCNPLPPFDCPGHEDFGDDTHQVFDLAAAEWGLQRPNQDVVTSPGCPVVPDLLIKHYPRLHVLANESAPGYIMQVDGKASTGTPSHVAWFLPSDDSFANADCNSGLEPYNQWREGARIPGDTREASQKGAPSVHLLWPDVTVPTTYHEVVYVFGGHWEPHDDGAGCPPPPDGNHYASNRVARMTDPHPSKSWMEDVLPMPEGRVNHNAVILLDGSVMLVGGEDNPTGTCEYRTTPVVFRPEEFFGGAGGSYVTLAEQSDLRRYHSVSNLLPDGRVFSAGGAAENLGGGMLIGDPYSVELFSPPYLFATPNPTIETSFPGPWLYGQSQSINVRIPGGGEVKRVALVRVGASTHAFDSSQRYVVLYHDPPVSLGSDLWQVQILNPPNGNVAPPGWYMLTVTTPADGFPGAGTAKFVPSAAKWIKLQ